MSAQFVLDDSSLQRIYVWVDEIPLSRPKRSITRDFSDGVLMAEVVHHYFPKLVDMHNYSNANSAKQKMYNWGTLNQKVFRRLGFVMDKGEVESLVNCKPGAVELLLMRLQKHITEIRAGRRSMGSPHGALEMGGASGASHSAEEGGYDGGNGPTFNLYAGSNNNNNNNNAGGTNSSSSNTNVSQVNAPQAPRQQPSTHAPVAAPQLAAVPHQTHSSHHHDVMVDAAILSEKDATIRDLQETVEILELKIRKLEQLVKLKDSRIQTLTARLGGGVAPQ